MIESDQTDLLLTGVSKSFGAHQVLHDINLVIKRGEFVVFVGPSGCGKSTLLRMIAGLEEASDGTIEIAGQDVTDTDPSRRGIAMVFQSYALYPHMTVAQNMGFGLKVAGVAATEIAQKVQAAAKVLRLDTLLDRRPGQLSGGQRQRVAIGRAIVRNPRVFLFDEPLSNLDAELRVEMRLEIARLHRELGNTMIYVTHDQTEAMTLADRIVVLRGGRIEQVGSPAELYDNPANQFVGGFIGTPRMNFLPGRLSGDFVEVYGSKLPTARSSASERGDPIVVGMRPEHLRPAAGGEPSFPITVEMSEFLGGTTYLHGKTGDAQVSVAVDRWFEARHGDQVSLTISPDRILLFSEAGDRRGNA